MQQISANYGNLRNILFTISYDGTNYHGWQIQENAVTVQEVFQNTLFKIINEKANIKGCSRTDSGVHANMYCVSAIIGSKIPCERLLAAMNMYLSNDIAVIDCKEVPINFHARYSCKEKEYLYKILNTRTRNPFLNGYALHYPYPIDLDIIDKAAQDYVGKHDFTSFCTVKGKKEMNTIKTVKIFSIERDSDMILMKVRADGFLYNMVRIMVGTLIKISQGKISADAIPDIIKAKDRLKAGPKAQPHGLYLNKVFYEGV